MSLGALAKPQSPPRSSSAGLREGLRIYRAMQASDKAGQKLLEEMIAVQEHNEEAFPIVHEAYKEAKARHIEADAAEANLAVERANLEDDIKRERQRLDEYKAELEQQEAQRVQQIKAQEEELAVREASFQEHIAQQMQQVKEYEKRLADHEVSLQERLQEVEAARTENVKVAEALLERERAVEASELVVEQAQADLKDRAARVRVILEGQG